MSMEVNSKKKSQKVTNKTLSVIELTKKLNISPQRIISSISNEMKLNSKLSKNQILHITGLFNNDRLTDIEKEPQKKILNKLLSEKKAIIKQKPISTGMRD